MSFGLFKGQTIEDAVRQKGPSYISWPVDNQAKKIPNDPFTKIIRLYCEFAGI